VRGYELFKEKVPLLLGGRQQLKEIVRANGLAQQKMLYIFMMKSCKKVMKLVDWDGNHDCICACAGLASCSGVSDEP
jgi:hypothetical protein